jgi:hypothetical protein
LAVVCFGFCRAVQTKISAGSTRKRVRKSSRASEKRTSKGAERKFRLKQAKDDIECAREEGRVIIDLGKRHSQKTSSVKQRYLGSFLKHDTTQKHC